MRMRRLHSRLCILPRGAPDAAERGKSTLDYRSAGGSYQAHQISQIVFGQKHEPQDLFLHHKMSNRPPGEATAGHTGAPLLQRLRAESVCGVPKIESARSREGRPHPCRTGRQNTVENVDSAGDYLDETFGVTYAHEIAQAVLPPHSGREF